MEDEEKLIDQKTIAFLCKASTLVSSDSNLAADLDVTNRNYGYKPPRKKIAVAPPPPAIAKPTEVIAQQNPKKRAKTLSKLASLNDEKNRIGSSSGTSSLLSFMNSLRR